MTKRVFYLIISALVTVGMLSGCTIDVNELLEKSSVSSSSQVDSSSHSDKDTDTEKNTDTDSDDSESSETDTQTDTETDEPDSNFGIDTSNLQTLYITGLPSVPLLKDCSSGSDVLTNVSAGESVKFISDNGTGYWFVYYESTHSFGYVENIYIADEQSEVTSGENYYIKENKTALYSNIDRTEILKNLSKNSVVSVIAKDTSGYWLVRPNNSDTVGYVSAGMLSEEKITNKNNTSSKTESKSESKTESKAESKIESVVESKTESKTESKSESKTESKTESNVSEAERIIGIGDAPTSKYNVYSVDVESGYLALRSEQNSGDYCIIGELYTGEEAYVIDSSGYYWYVYSPTLGMYGYANSEFLVK